MAILILALADCLLDIVSPRSTTMFGARGKILGFGLLRWPENAFPSHGHSSVPNHLIFCTMYYKISIHLPPYKSQLLCQFSYQSKFLSHLTALSLTPCSTTAFFFEWPLEGSHGSSYENLERKTVS